MTKDEAIKAIQANWPDERYSMLREALNVAIAALSTPALAEPPPFAAGRLTLAEIQRKLHIGTAQAMRVQLALYPVDPPPAESWKED